MTGLLLYFGMQLAPCPMLIRRSICRNLGSVMNRPVTKSKHDALPEANGYWRLAWLLMLLLHLIPLAVRTIGAAPNEEADASVVSPLRAAFLFLSSAFFVLKIMDVPWLRFRTDGRATISWLVIVSVLHLGVLNRAIDEIGVPSDGSLQIVLFVGGAVAAATTLCLLNRSAVGKSTRPLMGVSIHSPLDWCAIFHSLCWISRTCPRAPPDCRARLA